MKKNEILVIVIALLLLVSVVFCIGGFIGYLVQGEPEETEAYYGGGVPLEEPLDFIVVLPTPDIKPVSVYLISTNDDWKELYGDTLETQMAYNLAVIRHDQKQIFNLIQAYHVVDPNALLSRIEALEVSDADSMYEWRLDVNSKINEIIAMVNEVVK